MENVHEVVWIKSIQNKSDIWHKHRFWHKLQSCRWKLKKVKILRVVVFYRREIQQGWLETSRAKVGQHHGGITVEEYKLLCLGAVAEVVKAADAVSVHLASADHSGAMLLECQQGTMVIDTHLWTYANIQ